MSEIKVVLTNAQGCTFDCSTFSSASAAVKFSKGRGGTYSAAFGTPDAINFPEQSSAVVYVSVYNCDGRTVFALVDYERCKETRISAADLADKISSICK